MRYELDMFCSVDVNESVYELCYRRLPPPACPAGGRARRAAPACPTLPAPAYLDSRKEEGGGLAPARSPERTELANATV